MPRRIVRQPNGLYAEFSTIVDTFTYINMTREEAVNHCLGAANSWPMFSGTPMTREEAIAKVERGTKEQKYYNGPEECGEPLWRWNYDLDTVGHIHGDEEMSKLERWCSIPEDVWNSMYDDGEELPEGMEWNECQH